jgi:hypothetical protein
MSIWEGHLPHFAQIFELLTADQRRGAGGGQLTNAALLISEQGTSTFIAPYKTARKVLLSGHKNH